MTEESTNNDLNLSNKDTFLAYNNRKGGILVKSDINRVNTHQTVMLEEKIEENSLDDLGKIEEAKKHRSANRPLHKLKDFNSSVNFCRCCNLPCEEKGILEPFHYCDDIDNFSECGLGVSLYFHFFKFAAVVLFIGMCVMAIGMIVFNHHYTKGINRVCNNNYEKLGRNDIGFCEGFITVANQSLNIYNRFNDWILRFTSDNIEIYQLLHYNTTNITKNVDDVSINYSVLNFCFLLTIFILNIYCIIFIAAQSQRSKLLNLSIRDFTVLISNAKYILVDYLNSQQKDNPYFNRDSQMLVESTEHFINFVNEYIRSDKNLIDLKINHINMCYNLGNYIELRDELEKCKKKIFKIKNDPRIIKINSKKGYHFENRCYYSFPIPLINCIRFKGKPLITLQKQSQDLQKHIDLESENIQKITESNFTGYMFVSFNKIKDKETILKEYPNNFFDRMIYYIKNIKYYLFCCCLSKGEKLKFNKIKGIDVDDPPEPEDLYWENFKYNARSRGIRIILVFAVCIIIIGISFGIVLGFTVLQNKIIDNDKSMHLFVKYLLSLFITIIISVVNEVLEVVLTKFTFLEKHLSRTSFYLSLSIKITIFTFFNSAIIPLLSKHIIVKKQVEYSYNLDRNNLVVSDMFVLFTVNAIITPLFWTFRIPYLIQKLRIYLIEKNPEPDNCHHMTQRQLNALYELPDMKIAYKYSFIAKTLAMTLFYLPIFPLGFIISFIGFVLGYLLELYNFTHLYKRPEMLDEIITKVYAEYFIIILFIGAIGDYFFFHDIFNNNKMSIANIIIFGVLIIVPYTKFITCNFVGIDKSEYHNYSLSDVYFTFYSDYQRQNPLTKRIGLLNYLKDLRKNGYLSDNAYKVAEENIDKLNIMEIYYGISRGNIPILHQSVMANKNRSISGKDLRQSIVAPKIEDDHTEKRKKQKYFDSQIMNIFGNKNSKKMEYPIDFPMDTIIEEEDDNTNVKNKLINAYNNPLAINMGLGPILIDPNIYKSTSITKSLSKDLSNIKNNNVTTSKKFEEGKSKSVNLNMYENKFKNNDNIINNNQNGNNNNDNTLDLSKDFDKNSNTLPFDSSKNSISQGNKNNYNDNSYNNNTYNINQNNNTNDLVMPQNEYNYDSKNDVEENNNNLTPNNLNINKKQNGIDISETPNENNNNININNSSNISDDSNNNNNNNNINNIQNTNNINDNKYEKDTLSLNNNDNIIINSSPIRNKTSNSLLWDSSLKNINLPLDEQLNNNENDNNNMNINSDINKIQNNENDIKDNNKYPKDNYKNDGLNKNGIDIPRIPTFDENRIELNLSESLNKEKKDNNNISDFFNENNNDLI